MLLSPFTELFSFDVTVFNFFLLGWLSSGTSYILNMLFGDHGLQIYKQSETKIKLKLVKINSKKLSKKN